jgi:hypothetical protein
VESGGIMHNVAALHLEDEELLPGDPEALQPLHDQHALLEELLEAAARALGLGGACWKNPLPMCSQCRCEGGAWDREKSEAKLSPPGRGRER